MLNEINDMIKLIKNDNVLINEKRIALSNLILLLDELNSITNDKVFEQLLNDVNLLLK